eukprot:1861975-Heterocapsa_arctica.AAC.1
MAIEAHIAQEFPRLEPEDCRKHKKCTKSDPHKEAVLSINILGHSLINVGRSYTCIQCGFSGGKTLGSWKVKCTCKGHLAIRNGRA